MATYLRYTNIADSIWLKIPDPVVMKNKTDSIIPDSARHLVYDASLSIANNMKSSLESNGNELENRKKEILFHEIEWHRKFSLSMACLVLFFIGAPLGSIIRKGGLGMPLVVAIIFFLIFHLLNMFGEKFVKENITSPFIGMWLAVIALTPLGIFLTYKAIHDSQLFSKEFYYRFFKKMLPFLSNLKSNKKTSA